MTGHAVAAPVRSGGMGDGMSQVGGAIAFRLIFWTLFRALPQLTEGWAAVLVLLAVGGIHVGSRQLTRR